MPGARTIPKIKINQVQTPSLLSQPLGRRQLTKLNITTTT